MVNDGRLLTFLALAGLGAAAAVRGSRGVVRMGRNLGDPKLGPTLTDVRTWINISARDHGINSEEPDHEIGDIQGAIRIALTRFLPQHSIARFLERASAVEHLPARTTWLTREPKWKTGKPVFDELWARFEEYEKGHPSWQNEVLVERLLALTGEDLVSADYDAFLDACGAEVGWETEPPEWGDRPNVRREE